MTRPGWLPSGSAGSSRTERLVVLAVVCVLAVLIGLVLPRLSGDAGESGCERDRRALERAVLEHQDRTGDYPEDLEALEDGAVPGGDADGSRLVRDSYVLTYDRTTGAVAGCSR